MSSPPPPRSPGQPGTVLIVTVTRPEGRAVLLAFEQLTGGKAQPMLVQQRPYQDLGQVQGVRVLFALSEVGNGGLGGSQESVGQAVRDLQPDAVIMVGIAFGVNPGSQKIGQVLVSEQIVAYELQHKGEQAPVLWGDKPHASPLLIKWLKHVDLTLPDDQRIQFGPILSGEKLIDNLAWREGLQALSPAAIGGEMEGAGLYVACQNAKTDWILVKAICDWADGNKDQNKAEQQALAAKNAAGLIAHALHAMPLFGALDAGDKLAAGLPAPPVTPPPLSSLRSLPNGGKPEEQLAELLAFCDRTEIMLKLEALLKQHTGLHLLCFADHVNNRPGKLHGRIKTELAEKLKHLRLDVFDAKDNYGFEAKRDWTAVELFGKALCEAASVPGEAELCQQLRASRADALLLWQYDECTSWSQASIAQCLRTACRWLETVGKLGQPTVPIILLLVLRYDTPQATPGWFAKLRRPGLKKRLADAYRQVHAAPGPLVQLAFDEMLILPDYSREDFRRWLKLDRVRDYLGGSLPTFEDEALLARHFPKGSNHYTALLEFLKQHHMGTQS